VSRSKVFSANDGGVELAVVPGRSAHSEQGLVSGVMRCLFCGQFPLLCVVHALVVFSSFLSHPEDRSWLRPPPSPFLPPLVAEFVVFGAPAVALEYISMA